MCNKECITESKCYHNKECGFGMTREGEFVKSPTGHNIRVDNMTVGLHISKHNVDYATVKEAVSNPKVVTTKDGNGFSYKPREGKNSWLRVVWRKIFGDSDDDEGLGFVVTAYPTRKINEDEEVLYED